VESFWFRWQLWACVYVCCLWSVHVVFGSTHTEWMACRWYLGRHCHSAVWMVNYWVTKCLVIFHWRGQPCTTADGKLSRNCNGFVLPSCCRYWLPMCHSMSQCRTLISPVKLLYLHTCSLTIKHNAFLNFGLILQ
jgi:hypothetical protein